MPDKGNPQGFDRYSYVANNPISRIDTSGHCWGVASFIRGIPTYSTTCNNLDLALTIVQSDQASASDRIVAGAYITGEFVAHGTAVVYGAIITCGLVSAACYTAITGGTAACADGDCANEAVTTGKALQGAAQTAQSVWNMPQFARGNQIERLLGGNLARNNPVIDFWDSATGLARSIKSINLNATTYQNISNLTDKVLGYVKTLARWSGIQNWAGVRINPGQVQMRELMLALPPNSTQAQLTALQQLQQTALNTYNIVLTLVTIR